MSPSLHFSKVFLLFCCFQFKIQNLKFLFAVKKGKYEKIFLEVFVEWRKISTFNADSINIFYLLLKTHSCEAFTLPAKHQEEALFQACSIGGAVPAPPTWFSLSCGGWRSGVLVPSSDLQLCEWELLLPAAALAPPTEWKWPHLHCQ